MFKVEGLSVPATVKVDESKKKKKAESAKLSGDDLQGMFSELGRKPKQRKPDVQAGPKGKREPLPADSKQAERTQRKRTSEATTAGAEAPLPTKRAKAAGPELKQDKPRQDKPKQDRPKQDRPKQDKLKQDRPKQDDPRSKDEKKRGQTKPDAKSQGKSESEAQTKTKAESKTAKATAKAERPGAAGVVKPLQPSRGPTSTKQLTPLQLKMQQKLSGARFRWINEQLYTTSSEQAFQIFQEQPQVFQEYHDGFRHQVESWPENPVVSLVQQFKDRLQKPLNAPGGLPADKPSGQVTIADMGCGEAELALELGKFQHRKARFNVHSFDLYAANERITAADISNVPLPDESCHVVVFCLALMGTNLADFVAEGIRVLKPGGLIWIAEIKSRFSGYDTFIDTLKKMGLYHRTTDESNKMFVKFEFAKLPHKMAQATETHPELTLKPCIYKRR